MITNILDKSGITYTTGTKSESEQSLNKFKDAVFEAIYNTDKSTHQVPTQPCEYEYNYCSYRLPCGICRLTNQPCRKSTNTITPLWETFPTIITCEVH